MVYTIDTNKGKVYVANQGNDTVSVIDENTNKVIKKPVHVGPHPTNIAIDTKLLKIYIVNEIHAKHNAHDKYKTPYSANGTVSVIDENTDTVIGQSIHVGPGPQSITIDTDKGKVYVVNQGNDTVSVIDENTNKVMNKSINVHHKPVGIACGYKIAKDLYINLLRIRVNNYIISNSFLILLMLLYEEIFKSQYSLTPSTALQ